MHYSQCIHHPAVPQLTQWVCGDLSHGQEGELCYVTIHVLNGTEAGLVRCVGCGLYSYVSLGLLACGARTVLLIEAGLVVDLRLG
ncbi:hypothetical protein [Microbacterium sp. NPDC091662]|uniref:hypothetical protein n=1 Tax=Microbacterium sp. NPDC091662 TaxID=3364211 RepID=UPI00380ACBB0